jgi:uncharacterized protein YkwD
MKIRKSIAIMLAMFNMTSMVAGSSITSFAQEDVALEEEELLIEDNEASEEIIEEIPEDEDQEISIDESASLVPQDDDDSEISFQSAESAKSYILNMNIAATDGKTYHVSDFSEDYVAIFFGRSTCYNTNSMVKQVASVRDNKKKSIKIIIMDVDDVDDGLANFAKQYSALASINSSNNNYMFGAYRSYYGQTGAVTLPVAAVLDSGRNLIFFDSGYHVSEVASVFKDSGDYVTYSFDMTYGQTESRNMLDSVNSFRTGSEAWAWDSSNSKKVYYKNLSKLEYDYGLEQVAMQRAAEIAVYYDHTRPDGRSCFTAYTAIGGAGENIAAGYRSAQAVFEGWREDDDDYSGQGHRRNMLGSDYKYIGIAHVQLDGVDYWVQEFNTVATSLNKTAACDAVKTVGIQIDKDNITSKTVTVNPTSIELEPDETASLPTVYEKIALSRSWPGSGHYVSGIAPTWSGYDSKIISVDKKNKTIKALTEGNTTLKATADGQSSTAKVKVEDQPNVAKVVAKKYNSLEDAKADKNGTTYDSGQALELPYMKTIYLIGEAIPVIAGKKSFTSATTAKVENSQILEYNATTGALLGKKTGTSKITFTSDRDPNQKAVITIKVKEVPITGIYFEKEKLFMEPGKKQTLKLLHEPEATSEEIKDVTWTSSDPSILSVTGKGATATLEAFDKEGSVQITAKMGKLTASVNVDVYSVLKLNKKTAVLMAKPGNTDTLTAALSSDSYKESELKWTSSDSSVLEVKKGRVTVLKNVDEVRSIRITVSTKDGKYSASCQYTINPWPKAETPTLSIPQGEVEKNSLLMMSSGNPATEIFYTIDYDDSDGISKPSFDASGNPVSGTKRYGDAIRIDKTMWITVVARVEGLQDSATVTYKYTVVFEWGDVNSKKLRAVFGDPADIPEGLWYAFGSEESGYSAYFTSTATGYKKTYTGGKITFNDEISVFHGNRKLWENRDYAISYANNQLAAYADAAKAPKVLITGKGSYSKTVSFTFSIVKADLSKAELISEENIVVSEGAKLSKIKPEISYEGRKLTAGKDVDITFYEDSVSEENRISDTSSKAEAGKSYTISVTASENGGFTGKLPVLIHVTCLAGKDITAVSLSKAKVTIPKVSWNSEGISVQKLFEEGVATVKVGSKILVYDRDYEVSSGKLYDAGKHSITIKGIAKTSTEEITYLGEKKATVEITGISASKVKVAGLNKKPEYTGKVLGLSDLYKEDKAGYKAVTLYTTIDGENYILTEGRDYDVDMNNIGSIGKLSVRFVLKGRFTGTITKTVTVKAANIKNALVSAADTTYRKGGAATDLTVIFGDMLLREGIDYKVSYKNNKKVADSSEGEAPTAVIKGLGNFTGTTSCAFTIMKASLAETVTLTADNKIYSEDAEKGYYRSAPRLYDGEELLAFGKDVEAYNPEDITYLDASTGKELNEDLVTAGTTVEIKLTVTCSERSPYKAGTYTLSGSYRVLGPGMDITKATVKVKDPSKLSFSNGKAIIPIKDEDLIVKLGKKTLSTEDYEIVSVTGNRFLGTARVKIRGKGSYGGTKVFTFKVCSRPLN